MGGDFTPPFLIVLSLSLFDGAYFFKHQSRVVCTCIEATASQVAVIFISHFQFLQYDSRFSFLSHRTFIWHNLYEYL
jgi:hypothetical protein